MGTEFFLYLTNDCIVLKTFFEFNDEVSITILLVKEFKYMRPNPAGKMSLKVSKMTLEKRSGTLL